MIYKIVSSIIYIFMMNCFGTSAVSTCRHIRPHKWHQHKYSFDRSRRRTPVQYPVLFRVAYQSRQRLVLRKIPRRLLQRNKEGIDGNVLCRPYKISKVDMTHDEIIVYDKNLTRVRILSDPKISNHQTVRRTKLDCLYK